jgi:diguanylate cyclase (GGDEF)-like protein
MSTRSPVRLYCAAVFIAGVLSIALLAGDANFSYILRNPLTFAVLGAGVALGEMLPIKIPRRGNDEELTLSSSFALALLIVGGLGPAVIAQGIASLVQDVDSRKPLWRQRFNVGQYTLSMVTADVIIRSLSAHHHLISDHPWASGQLPAMMLGAAAFFIVNTGLVGVAVALYQGMPIVRYFRNDFTFVLGTGGVMVLIAPIVLATTAYSVAIVPLCLAPVLAIYNSVSRSTRSEHAARHDSLTGLPNRAAFRDAVGAAVSDERIPAGVLLMDLDRFKEVNDTLGHRYGDLLLGEVAERFRAAVGADGQIARLGGDEFAVVCPGRGADDTLELATRLGEVLGAAFEVDGVVLDVQASIGVALFPDHGGTVEALLQKADVAMYRAKETRRGLALYEERHDHNSPARLALTAELRNAVDTDEILIHFQPELDLRIGAVTAVEALVRWDHPGAGVLAPSSFVKLAEQANLIKPLTHRVIELALGQAAAWRRLGHDLTVAVNISPQVLVDRSFTDHVVGALHAAGVPPGRLKLEVTESTLMADPFVARSVLRELDGLGVEISIDDFGTGYSSLAYLAELPVSEVKIDRSFVSRMTTGSGERIIVNSTIDLAHHLGLRAVAEGVDDLALLPQLAGLGCDVAQGYAISRPLAAGEFFRWLTDFNAAELIGLCADGVPAPANAAELSGPGPASRAGDRLAGLVAIPAVGRAT